jgi:cytochrome c-type biogenesis protein CcmF
MFARIVRANLWKIGGYLAHIGVALALVGIIGTNAYKTVERATVYVGQSAQALGYSFQFQGLEQVSDDQYAVQLVVRRGGESFLATPKLQPTDQGIVRTPYIHKYLTADLYISPGDYVPAETSATLLDITKGESQQAEGYTFKFVDFARFGHDMQTGSAITVGAVLEVSRDGVTTVITPTMTVDQAQQTIQTPVDLPGSSLQVVYDGADVDRKIVGLAVYDKNKPATTTDPSITLEVSREPGINLLWVGLIIIALGTAVAVVRRRIEGRRAFLAAEPAMQPVTQPAPPTPQKKAAKKRK